VQVRVVQNKEPDHMLSLFKGTFLIRTGGKGSGFKNVGQKDTEDGAQNLFHVRGTSPVNTKATQVPFAASSLNSNDCFIVENSRSLYLWHGKHANADERDTARKIAERLTKGRTIDVALESQEKKEFWETLGGKEGYAYSEKREEVAKDPRLFVCSNASGNFTVEEVFDFVQEDLVEDDVFMLDTFDQIFLWIGQGANAEEKKRSLETAIAYLKGDPSGRSPETTPILTVKQGFEPPMFTSQFVWDANKAKSAVKDYDAMKAQLQSGATAATAQEELKKYSMTYPYATLKVRPLPDGVDASQLENFLNENEFPTVFGMTKKEFNALSAWKKTDLKKAKKMY